MRYRISMWKQAYYYNVCEKFTKYIQKIYKISNTNVNYNMIVLGISPTHSSSSLPCLFQKVHTGWSMSNFFPFIIFTSLNYTYNMTYECISIILIYNIDRANTLSANWKWGETTGIAYTILLSSIALNNNGWLISTVCHRVSQSRPLKTLSVGYLYLITIVISSMI